MRYTNFVWLFLSSLVTGCTSLLVSTPTLTPEPTLPPQPIVRIHYLGHASFLLQFDNGVSVLTDYGQSSAYGLDSPIYDWVGLEPDLVTFSHAHPDHKRPDGQFGQARVLTDMDRLSLKGLEITPIRTSEASIEAADNSSYLFTYQGLKILHLADAQAYITAIEQAAVKQKVKALYPDTYDVLLMTIQGTSEFIPQAEEFIDWLQPVRVIPMHYWSPAYKADFLAQLNAQNQAAGKHYIVTETGGAEYAVYAGDKAKPIQVISLEPASFSPTK
jgi:L-ascorbate metabolism protein UlaG (beta-lactamase superfamily)